jgi:hypothetical protein
MIITDATGVQTSLRAYSHFPYDCSESLEPVNEHYERALTPQPDTAPKRRFPTVGGEPQGKPPHEMATFFPME